jgi:hypothetical protein
VGVGGNANARRNKEENAALDPFAFPRRKIPPRAEPLLVPRVRVSLSLSQAWKGDQRNEEPRGLPDERGCVQKKLDAGNLGDVPAAADGFDEQDAGGHAAREDIDRGDFVG